MDFSLILRRLKTNGSYYISIGIFIILVIGIASSLYYSALKIDYVWRWFRIPQYFVYQDQVEIRAEIEGDVQSILIKDKKANPSHYAMLTISEGAHPIGGTVVESGPEDAYGHRKLGGIGELVSDQVKRLTPYNTIYQRVAYLMRSGAPDSRTH